MDDYFLIVNTGSVDDIKCSLRFITPEDRWDAHEVLGDLNFNISHEKKYKKRKTVITLLEAKIKQIKKLFEIE